MEPARALMSDRIALIFTEIAAANRKLVCCSRFRFEFRAHTQTHTYVCFTYTLGTEHTYAHAVFKVTVADAAAAVAAVTVYGFIDLSIVSTAASTGLCDC